MNGQNFFDAPELWHEPREVEANHKKTLKIVVQPPGAGYVHAVTPAEIRARILWLPNAVQQQLDVVQLSRMTRKRSRFPMYGLQWGTAVYLYPLEAFLVEQFQRIPSPAWQIETEMYGGKWQQANGLWQLVWTPKTLKDFYLNNILIHEIGHVIDKRNSNTRDRERFANWFAIEYGYRPSRGR